MDAVAVAARFGLASVFLLAGLSKLARRNEFVQAVRSYGLLPDRLAGRLARWLPLAEIVVGLALLVGVAVRFAALTAGALLAAFAGAVALALLRGREIDCGCFSAVAPRRMTWLTVVRNLTLLAAAGLVLWVAPRALSLDEWLAGPSGGTVSQEDAVALAITSTAALAALALAQGWRRAHRARAAFGASSGVAL